MSDTKISIISIIVIIALMGLGRYIYFRHQTIPTEMTSIVREYVDSETGVHYLRDAYKGGLTPRLNSDGTVMVDETTRVK